jgi:hypothetical protein
VESLRGKNGDGAGARSVGAVLAVVDDMTDEVEVLVLLMPNIGSGRRRSYIPSDELGRRRLSAWK